MENPPTQPLVILSRPLEGLPGVLGAQHTALGIGSPNSQEVYEVAGQGYGDSGKQQTLLISPRKQHTPFTTEKYVGHVNPEDLKRIATKWVQNNGTYDIVDANCQRFVVESVRELGYSPEMVDQATIIQQAKQLFSPSKKLANLMQQTDQAKKRFADNVAKRGTPQVLFHFAQTTTAHEQTHSY